MKKSRRGFPHLIIVFMFALVLTGCLGGGSSVDEHTVQDFLNDFTIAFESLRPNRIADLFDLPIVISEDITITKSEFVEATEPFFEIIRKNVKLELDIKGAKINDTDNEAVITDASLYAKIKVTEAQAKTMFKELMSLAFEAFGDTTYVALQEFATAMELPANIKLPKGPDEVEQFIDEIWGLILPENSTWVDLWEPEPLPFEDLVLKKVGGKWKFHIDTSDLGFDSFGVLGLAR